MSDEIRFGMPTTFTDIGNGRVWPGTAEISGFGGDYEDHCRKMLRGGLEWLDAHPDANPMFKGYRGVFGFADAANEDAKALDAAICAAGGNDFTGAMHHAVVNACLFIKANGWEEYTRRMAEAAAKSTPTTSSGATCVASMCKEPAVKDGHCTRCLEVLNDTRGT